MPTGAGNALPAARAMSHELGAPELVVGGGMPNQHEETPELQWPLNLRVYDRMRKTDGQTRGLIRSWLLPALQTHWGLQGTTVRPEVMRLVQAELGLVPDERGRRRGREGGVSFDPFLRHAMLHPVFGFFPFELWQQIGPPDAGVDPGIGAQVAHLGLSPRMPRSVEFIDVNTDGSLIGIRQWISRGPRIAYPGQTPGQVWPNASGFIAPSGDMALVPIPAGNMAYFCNEQEGADWAGQSVLRSAYKHWLIKDFLMRVDANAADRNGSGLPVVTHPDEPGARARALAIASAVRTGDEAGVALPDGWTLALMGVQGSTHDTAKSIAMHEQAAAKAMLAMFMELGHDGGLGHGSLGETFVDYFLLSLRALLRYTEEVITEQIIRPLVRWNFGPNEAYPTIVADDPSAESTPTAQALMQLANAGLLIGDPGARAEIRRRYGMPVEGDEAVQIPFMLPRGVTDPMLPQDPTGIDPQVLPDGPFLPPARPAGPPARPALPPAPTPGGPPGLPATGAAVDRKGRTMQRGSRVGVALAGGIVGGTVVQVTSPSEVLVDVAGTVGRFTPGECQLAAAPPPAPLDPELAGMLERTHALSERLLAAASSNRAGAFADPGYLPDGQRRFPIGTPAECEAALTAIAAPATRSAYTARQLQLVEARIRAAARRLGAAA